MTEQEYYKSIAEQALKEKEEKQNRTGFDGNIEYPEWTGFTKENKKKLVRFYSSEFIHKSEDFTRKDFNGNLVFNKYSARIVNYAKLYNDSGKLFCMYIPSKEDEPGFFYWRVLDTVLKKEWSKDSDGKPVAKYIYAESYPEIFDRLMTNGRIHKELQYHNNVYDRGWKAQKILLTNVIDREQIERHRELKKAFLLSKNMNVVGDQIYFENGVPANGLDILLYREISNYCGLNNYDLLLERTGQKSPAWIVCNASEHIKEVPTYLQPLVANTPLTEEELSWEQYDLEAMTNWKRYSKWQLNVGQLLKKIDLSFKTHFSEEVEEKANKEKAETERVKKENSTPVSSLGADLSKPEEVKRRPAPVSTETKSNTAVVTWDDLQKIGCVDEGKKYFTSEAQALIDHVDFENRQVKWKAEAGEVQACFAPCDFKSPVDPSVVKGCLMCGSNFV